MIPYFKPSFDSTEVASLVENLGSDDARERFEEEFARRTGFRFAVAFSYARAALYSSLIALGLRGVEVLIPSYTCIAVPHAIVRSGNIPTFADIDLTTYNIDTIQIQGNLSKRVKVIIPTHMFGHYADVEILKDIAKEAIIIEDASHALPLDYASRSRSNANSAFFSLSLSKQITTLDGGVLATDDTDLCERVLSVRNRNETSGRLRVTMQALKFVGSYFGFNEKAWRLASLAERTRLVKRYLDRQGLSTDQINAPFDLLRTFSSLQAAIGLAQLKKMEKISQQRRKLTDMYHKLLNETKGLVTPAENPYSSSHFTIRVKNKHGFRQSLARRGIGTGATWDYSIPQTPAYAHFKRTNACINSMQAAREVVNLPFFTSLPPEDTKRICYTARMVVDRLSS